MILPLLITLALTITAVCLSFSTTEEIVRLAAVLTAVLCIFFLLVVAPIAVKLLIILTPTISNKIRIGDFRRVKGFARNFTSQF